MRSNAGPTQFATATRIGGTRRHYSKMHCSRLQNADDHARSPCLLHLPLLFLLHLSLLFLLHPHQASANMYVSNSWVSAVDRDKRRVIAWFNDRKIVCVASLDDVLSSLLDEMASHPSVPKAEDLLPFDKQADAALSVKHKVSSLFDDERKAQIVEFEARPNNVQKISQPLGPRRATAKRNRGIWPARSSERNKSKLKRFGAARRPKSTWPINRCCSCCPEPNFRARRVL